ncbi:MAG: nicotinate-nucleotide adenylyltransferase [Clostridia bacterium]|nr:nicotinate-nucleotide adenylyltransferase [Clostridia bacterium]
MRIGLYGGTFSPPHNGHIRAARLFLREARLDKLYIMPAGIPPHKKADAWGDGDSRLEMAALAFGEFSEISDYEIRKSGRSYTVETLRYLKEKHPEDELFMLVGEDMFLSLDTWKAPEEIMKLCKIVTMRREATPQCVMEAAAEDYRRRYGACVKVLEAEPLRASSTDIREKIAKGESVSEFLPSNVAEYICVNGLYRNDC